MISTYAQSKHKIQIMDKFVNKLPDGGRHVVKKNKYDDNDSRSISENINNSLILKGSIPTLKPGSTVMKKQVNSMNNPIDDLLNKTIDKLPVMKHPYIHSIQEFIHSHRLKMC